MKIFFRLCKRKGSEPFAKLETALYEVPAPKDDSISTKSMAKAIDEAISSHYSAAATLQGAFLVLQKALQTILTGMEVKRMNIKALLMLVLSSGLCVGALYGYGEHARLAAGHITFTFTPVGYPGSTGTWQPVVISPDGEYIAGPDVPCDSTDPVEITADCCFSAFTEIGTYGIELKNRIAGSADIPLVSSIVVTPYVPTIPFDTIIYRSTPSTWEGDNVLMFYVLPTMEED